jgi:bifunctional non-homologous end joining protein LigD
MRAQLRVARDGSWCLRSRRGRDCSEQFPELAGLAGALAGHDLILDGELVSLASDGHPDFHTLRRRLGVRRPLSARWLAVEAPVTLVAFDVLHLDGHTVRVLPHAERRRTLERLLCDGPAWRVPEPLNGSLQAALAVTRSHGLEGIVAKRLDAPYEPGRRAGAWRKHNTAAARCSESPDGHPAIERATGSTRSSSPARTKLASGRAGRRD